MKKRVCKKNSQASLEYLVIVGIATLLLIPVLSLFYTSTNESSNLANSNLITILGKKMISESENVFFQGKNSKLKLSFNFPNNLKKLRVNSGSLTSPFELIFESEFNGLRSDLVFYSDFNLTFTNITDPCGLSGSATNTAPDSFLRDGYKEIFVESCGDFVGIYLFDK